MFLTLSFLPEICLLNFQQEKICRIDSAVQYSKRAPYTVPNCHPWYQGNVFHKFLVLFEFWVESKSTVFSPVMVLIFIEDVAQILSQCESQVQKLPSFAFALAQVVVNVASQVWTSIIVFDPNQV